MNTKPPLKTGDSSRRFDSVPRLSFIISELRKQCSTHVAKTSIFALAVLGAFLVGVIGTAALLNAVILREGGMVCGIILVSFAGGLAAGVQACRKEAKCG